MPFNTIKYLVSGSDTKAYRKGNWLFGNRNRNYGTANTPDYGQTSNTDYWNTIAPPSSGYTLYSNKTSNGPAIYTFTSGTQLLNFCNLYLGANQTTVSGVTSWLDGQNIYALDPIQGAVVTYGAFSTRNGSTANYISKMDMTTGNEDSTFRTNLGTAFNNQITFLTQLQDGRYFCLGVFSTFNGTSVTRVAMLKPDGTLDTSFSGGTGFNSTPTNALVDEFEQRIYVGGVFTQYNGVSVNRIAKLMYDGTLDTTFTASLDGQSNHIDADRDFLYVTGNFTTVNNISALRFAKIRKSNGQLASLSGVGFNANTIPVRIDRSDSNFVYVGGTDNPGGAITSFNGVSIKSNMAKINIANWAVDTTFNTNISNFNARVGRIDFDDSNNLIVSGNFTNYASTSRSYIVKLSNTGNIVTAFNPPVPNGNVIGAMFLPDSKKIAIGGGFTSYGSTTADRFAVVDATTGTIDSNFVASFAGANLISQGGIEVPLKSY